ncbi:MAG: hypothetical protein IPK13_01805 [Deltaproteobacteria bacterium]|nr:hypothetical protein [Deltaproteobacteria bacterium]
MGLSIPKPFSGLPRPPGFEKKSSDRDRESQQAQLTLQSAATAGGLDAGWNADTFMQADMNGDGRLTGQEIQAFAAQVSSLTGMPVDAQTALAVCDLNQDGQISEAEWATVSQQLQSDLANRRYSSAMADNGIVITNNVGTSGDDDDDDDDGFPFLPRPF